MSKVLFFAIVGLLVVTEIFARSADNERSCGKHGDPCSLGCCDKLKCNEYAGKCMVHITEDMLKEGRAKLKPVQDRPAGSVTHSEDKENCGRHGDDCTRGCCKDFFCNTKAGRCMVTITNDMLTEARAKLKPVNSRAIGA